MPSNTITTTSHFPHPPPKLIAFIQSPTNILELNQYGMTHTRTSDTPPTYSISFNIPVLFGLFSIPVATVAVFEDTEDGVYFTTATTGARTSSRWSVVADGEGGGSVLVEEFRLLSCWWGVGWFILWTARAERGRLFKILEERMREEE